MAEGTLRKQSGADAAQTLDHRLCRTQNAQPFHLALLSAFSPRSSLPPHLHVAFCQISHYSIQLCTQERFRERSINSPLLRRAELERARRVESLEITHRSITSSASSRSRLSFKHHLHPSIYSSLNRWARNFEDRVIDAEVSLS